ncbi:MAG: TonB-dependent receptor, partial [Myxococcota bacterium]
NGAGFYYDYKNLQIFQLKNESGGIPVQVLLNANDADVYGVELELDMMPLQGFVPEFFEGLHVFGSFAWLESEYTDFKNFRINFVQSIPIPVLEDFSGNRLINSPEFSFAGYVQWMFEIGEFGRLGPRVDVSFKDQVFFNQNNFEPLSQPALWLVNLRVDYRNPAGNVEVAGWVRNLTDEVYVGDSINLSNFAGKVLYAIGDPRTYGATITLRY